MATPREIRLAAFQTLYQIDARAGTQAEQQTGVPEDPQVFKDALGEECTLTPGEQDKAIKLAIAAYADRAAADAAMMELAPGWPAYRQAAVDRAILRLSHYEMTRTGVNPKIVVNEAVELAKVFSTERSPAFINALLDKILKQVCPGAGSAEAGGAAKTSAESGQATG